MNSGLVKHIDDINDTSYYEKLAKHTNLYSCCVCGSPLDVQANLTGVEKYRIFDPSTLERQYGYFYPKVDNDFCHITCSKDKSHNSSISPEQKISIKDFLRRHLTNVKFDYVEA